METESVLVPGIKLDITIDGIGVALALDDPAEFSLSCADARMGTYVVERTFPVENRLEALVYLENLAMKLRPMGVSYTHCYSDTLRMLSNAIGVIRNSGMTCPWAQAKIPGRSSSVELTVCSLTEESLFRYLCEHFDITKKHRFELQFLASTHSTDMSYRVCGDVNLIRVGGATVPVHYGISQDVKARIPFQSDDVEVFVYASLRDFGLDRDMLIGVFAPCDGEVEPDLRWMDSKYFAIGYRVAFALKLKDGVVDG